MSKNDTGFDAFFRAVTSSKEFKKVATTNRGEEMKKGFDNLGEELKKAKSITSSFSEEFDTPEVREIGESYSTRNFADLSSEYSPKATQSYYKQEEKSKMNIKRFKDDGSPTWGFKGVAGMGDLKTELLENFIKPLKFKFFVQDLEKKSTVEAKENGESISEKEKIYKEINSAYKKFKVNIPTGMLFYGPPGTGKTFMTKKLAQELGAGFIKKSVGEFGSSYMHGTVQNIKKFFDDAKAESKLGPTILFLDEIDSLVSKRTNSVDGNKAEEVSQFLQEFNDLSEAENLIVIAATNRPDHLDSAILRSGRFDKKVYIGPPDFNARMELFKIYIEKEDRPHKDIDYKKLAELTDGYVAADIETICDEVARNASKSILDLANSLEKGDVNLSDLRDQLDDHIITMELLEKAIEKTTSSLKFVDMSIYENWEKGLGDEKVRV